MIEFTIMEKIVGVLFIASVFAFVAIPWMSLTHLSKLDDIEYELRKIREESERRSQNDI